MYRVIVPLSSPTERWICEEDERRGEFFVFHIDQNLLKATILLCPVFFPQPKPHF